MANLVYGLISPHPPILVPQIGGNRIKEVVNTKNALESACKKIKNLNPDTIIIITPHGEISSTTVHIYTSHVFDGDFSQFGSKLSFHVKGDPELGHKILKLSKEKEYFAAEIPESFLDHGILVPYSFVQSAQIKSPILPIAIALSPLKNLFEFGKILGKSIENSSKKVAIIASADMSHRLTQDAPSGYHPKGKDFDDKLVELVKKNDIEGILNFDTELAEIAGQDALWSISILLGALDGLKVNHNLLSYEGPFGVGYMVAEYEVIS